MMEGGFDLTDFDDHVIFKIWVKLPTSLYIHDTTSLHIHDNKIYFDWVDFVLTDTYFFILFYLNGFCYLIEDLSSSLSINHSVIPNLKAYGFP